LSTNSLRANAFSSLIAFVGLRLTDIDSKRDLILVRDGKGG
jgi:hypothetical protein